MAQEDDLRALGKVMDFMRGISVREFGIRKGLKKLVISSKIRIFIGENQ